MDYKKCMEVYNDPAKCFNMSQQDGRVILSIKKEAEKCLKGSKKGKELLKAIKDKEVYVVPPKEE